MKDIFIILLNNCIRQNKSKNPATKAAGPLMLNKATRFLRGHAAHESHSEVFVYEQEVHNLYYQQ